MKFAKRISNPSKDNKNYLRPDKGYNKCIQGNTKHGLNNGKYDVLPNCFSGETKFITSNGLKTFNETVGTIVEVLNENKEFTPAEIKSFGEQQLYKITFRNGYSCYCTANHRWVVDKLSTYKDKKYVKRIIKTTLELNNNDAIPYNYFEGNHLMSKEGIVHGIIFGDGSHSSNCSTYRVELYGNKKELEKYIEKPIKSEYDLKEVPSIYESEEYLRGFVAGLVATDGCVSEDNKGVTISNVNYDNLQKIENICYKIGIPINKIREITRDVSIGEYEYINHKIYELSLKLTNIEEILLKTSDKKKITKEHINIKYTRVKSIELTDRYEEVYCAVEPKTHTITLEHNILTGQCTGYAYGRYLEAQEWTSCKLPTCNAELWLNKNKTYPEGFTARLGSILVFGKGKVGEGADGAGHVMFVEGIAKDGTLLCSESGWNFTKSRMDTRKVKRDSKNRYVYTSKYTYLGCIYPQENFETGYYGELPTVALKYGMKGKQVKRLQDFLNWCLGESLAIDGHYGPSTRTAVKKYQTLYGLEVDGKFGPACIAKAKTIKF